MNLSSLLSQELIFPDLGGVDGRSVLMALADGVAATGAIDSSKDLLRLIVEREEVGSTAVGEGVAIPHCKLPGLNQVVLAVGKTQMPIAFDAPDEQPVSLFFLIVSSPNAPAEHLKCLAAISRWIRVPGHVERLRQLDSAESMLDWLRTEAIET